MLERFYPDVYLDSAYDIDYEKLYEQGYRGIIFDIDNTLVPHGAPADARSIALFERLRRIGYESMLLSNNKEPRVKSFNDKVKSRYIYKANKPFPESYLRAMQEMKTTPENTLFVGDQLFTDVWGAKKAGIRTYLTKPIHPKEEIQIVLKRILEKVVLFFYKRKCKKMLSAGGEK
ncbi:MAG: YqeG family HAD IIIA-type phosphatase [Roseburia sp.]|nr:YqeG family HAD IIIA-type phosphatase [Ruminococcus sp.]MCM1154414.1 YqeG family HAD IIIA-type phosphatase [Roseburia sp.]MCM1243643.1 YqeG family HAD IIIA-type phosphatase [Roseburia sp.]